MYTVSVGKSNLVMAGVRRHNQNVKNHVESHEVKYEKRIRTLARHLGLSVDVSVVSLSNCNLRKN